MLDRISVFHAQSLLLREHYFKNYLQCNNAQADTIDGASADLQCRQPSI